MKKCELSIPHPLLKAADIPPNRNLTVQCIPGVILIGEDAPLFTAQWPLLELLSVLGIEPDEVYEVLEKGGYYDE